MGKTDETISIKKHNVLPMVALAPMALAAALNPLFDLIDLIIDPTDPSMQQPIHKAVAVV